jgi:glutamate dehydrogenase/leucine dehydrogenase
MIKKVNVSSYKEYKGHELVFYFEDNTVGLRGYLAFHSTKNGPATGGTRVSLYPSDEEAISDVLRLSHAMTLKCKISQVPFSGGKSVIICDPKNKTEGLLKSYAKIIHSFNGLFTTGTDMGLNDDDVIVMREETPYVLKGNHNGITTSQMAAWGVFSCMEKITPLILNKSISNSTVSIKGVGKLGGALSLYLDKAGSDIFIADTDIDRISKVSSMLLNKPKVVSSDLIHKIESDIFSPCALGNEFTIQNINEIKSKIILGGANNQLMDDNLANDLKNKNIWYIPDFVVNAGGLIHIVDELGEGGYNSNRVRGKIKELSETVALLVNRSMETGKTPLDIACEISNK